MRSEGARTHPGPGVAPQPEPVHTHVPNCLHKKPLQNRRSPHTGMTRWWACPLSPPSPLLSSRGLCCHPGASLVIPALLLSSRRRPGSSRAERARALWIPACAGMTGWWARPLSPPSPLLSPRGLCCHPVASLVAPGLLLSSRRLSCHPGVGRDPVAPAGPAPCGFPPARE